jgi:hypothetical protein
MNIDIKCLKTDRGYWDEVAPEGAEFYGEEDYEWVESWYKKQDGIWYRHIGVQGWTNISNAGCDFDDFIHSRAGSLINRPETQTTQWSGPQDGWPPVGTEFEFSTNSVSWDERVMLFNDGVTCLIASKKYPANRWHYKSDDPDMLFRPIQTERDKAIEAAVKIIEETGRMCEEDTAVALYDAGLLKAPSDD